jgi:hypothetical protein
MAGKQIGKITHYFNKIGVAAILLTDELEVGDTIHVLGRNTDFKQQVASMQLEHQDIEQAAVGQEIAIKVEQRVRRNDKVYKLE